MFTPSKKSTVWSLIATALVCMVTLLAARTLRAEPAVTTQETSYRHVPVSLWLIPQISTSGMADAQMETNLALSLGVSGYSRLRGFDGGVGGSWISHEMTGAQATVGFNYVGQKARGAQLTVGANLAPGQMTGLQASSAYNHAGTLQGVQLGLINYGGEVSGAQIGLINLGGRVRGAQIGLLNLSEEADVPIGLVSLVKDGQQHLELWGSDSAAFNLGLKLGGRYVYSLLTAGYQPRVEDDPDSWMVGLGLGGHIPLSDRFYIDADLVSWHVNQEEAWTDELNLLNKLRVIGGYRVNDRFAVFAGATCNLLVTRLDDGSDFGLITGRRLTDADDETTVRVWPGFVAGMRL